MKMSKNNELHCPDCVAPYVVAWEREDVTGFYPTCLSNAQGHCVARVGGDVVDWMQPLPHESDTLRVVRIRPDTLIRVGRRFLRIVNVDTEEVENVQ